MARELNISGGAVVLDVKPGSLAEDAGLMAQGQGITDIIVAANGRKIESAMDLLNIVKGLKSGEDVVLKFHRATGTQVFTYYTSITKP